MSFSHAIESAGGALQPLTLNLTCSNFRQGQENYIQIRPEHLSFSTPSNYNTKIRKRYAEILYNLQNMGEKLKIKFLNVVVFNPLNTELNPICQ